MKKDNIARKQQEKKKRMTIGLDLGDRSSRYCVLGEQGEVLSESSVPTTKKALAQTFGSKPRGRIALEVGTHSPWVSRCLTEMGHEVIVANARRVRLITDSSRKNDRLDAKTLARLARVDPELLSPIRHRSEQAQADLIVIRARAALIEVRTMLVNCARGLTKSYGERLRSCDPDQFRQELAGVLSKHLQDALKPLLAEVESVSKRIQEYDEQIENIAKSRYPETELLQQVHGVGILTSLTYVLTVEDPQRFRRSREVGAYFGLRPKQRESGDSQPQLRITKEGDAYVRKLLVQCSHYILGPFGQDSDLRRWGLKLAERGGKNAKKRAFVAVARKLAVLLHKLWITGEIYQPLYVQKRSDKAVA
ncbi:MAG: IS110 family transposase [Acidobacteria bacterium]|jgi:transposase|nr:MAG: IS110 family transposase [Acidobacteriota bacterium]